MPQQQPRSRTGGPRSAARLVRGAALAGSLALLPLAAACSGGEDDTESDSKASQSSAVEAGVIAPAKVEVIANLTSCEARIRVEAEELREGVCHTKGGDYLITTFPEEKYKQAWLDTISMYQGNYLVGSRWVISGQSKVLRQFQPKVGGTIVHMTGMGPTPAPSAS